MGASSYSSASNSRRCSTRRGWWTREPAETGTAGPLPAPRRSERTRDHKRLRAARGTHCDEGVMPAQFSPIVPNTFQSLDSAQLWTCDPVLVIVLAFVLVPIGLAILMLVLQAFALLSSNTSCRRNTRNVVHRAGVLRSTRSTSRLNWRSSGQRKGKAVSRPRRSRRAIMRRSTQRRVRRR